MRPSKTITILCLLVGAGVLVQGEAEPDPDQPNDLPAIDPRAQPVPLPPPVSADVRVQFTGPYGYEPNETVDLEFYLENSGPLDINFAEHSWDASLYKLSDEVLDPTNATLLSFAAAVAGGTTHPLYNSTFPTALAATELWRSYTVFDVESDNWVPQGTICPFVENGPAWSFYANGTYLGDGTYLYAVGLLGSQFAAQPVGFKFLSVAQGNVLKTVSQTVTASTSCGTGSLGPMPMAVGSNEQGYIFKARNRFAPTSIPVTWHYQGDYVPTNPNLSATNARTAISNSAPRWDNTATGSIFDINQGSDVTGNLFPEWDNLNVVGWGSLAPDVAAATYCVDSMGNGATQGNMNPPTDCDVWFNTNLQWSSTSGVTNHLFLEDVATHEFGHVLRLNDLSKTGAYICADDAVYQTMCQGPPVGSAHRVSLEWGDLAGARYLYPPRHTAVDQWTTGVRTGVGDTTGGTDAAAAFINAGSQADLLVAWIVGGSGTNSIYYRVLYDLSVNTGAPASTDPIRLFNSNIGSASDGLAVEIARIGGLATPDLFVAWVEALSGENEIRYQIGWDIDSSGVPTGWSPVHHASTNTNFNVGAETGGLDACIRQINGAGNFELVFAWMDGVAGDNIARYVVGNELSTTGIPLNWGVRQAMAGPSGAATWEGDATDGFGFDCMELAGGGIDYVFAWIDSPTGDNKIYYRVGENVPASGIASTWYDSATSSHTALKGPGVAHELLGDGTQGLGVAVADLDFQQSDELILVWTYDPPSGPNTIYYRVEWNGQYLHHY